MITNETVAKLADLARISITKEEQESLKNDLENILSYVEEINSVDTDGERSSATQVERKNVVRSDEVGVEPGSMTRSLVDSAPSHKDDYITVKKILSQE